jgi:uncharacterized membrane protein
VSGRTEFLAALRAGLRGAPASAIDEVVADYAAHFDEGVAANRTESDIAAALGDPYALAGEVRMELRIEAFESAPSPRSAAKVIADAVALGMINIVLLCVAVPFLAIVAFATMLAILAFAGGGVWLLVDGATLGLPGGIAATVLCASGLIFAAVSLAALLLLSGKALVSAIGRYAQLRFRFLPRDTQPGKSP